MNRNFAKILPSMSVLAALLATTAQAQTSSADNSGIETVVVTGTMIRGIQPVGSQLISVDSAQVQATGAVTTDQLLSNIPQVSNFFNAVPNLIGTINSTFQTNRPSLRSLPKANTSTGSATLVLVDGHRVVGGGIGQDAVDPDIVPPSLIDRVEIVTDGNSAIYGSDAIGGVMNFITKRSFDGVEVNGRYGAGDSYNSYDASITAGKDWGSGSAFISYGYSEHTSILVRDRGYAKNISWVPQAYVPGPNGTFLATANPTTTGIPTGRNCVQPNVTVGSDTYAVTNGVIGPLGSINACDSSQYADLFPQETRHNIFAGVSQNITSSIKFDLRAFYSLRTDYGQAGEFNGSASITPANPYYQDIAGPDSGASQGVAFNFDPVVGRHAQNQKTSLGVWGVTPTITADLFSDWQLRAMLNYGQSRTIYENAAMNSTALANDVAGTGTIPGAYFDPYNVSAASNQQFFGEIFNAESYGQSQAIQKNARLIADGTLFHLPGGAVHSAIGVEYLSNYFDARTSGSQAGGIITWGAQDTLPWNHPWTQTSKSAFAELEVPVVGGDFTFPLVQRLELEGAIRYDKFNDVGETWNPHVGVEYRPIDWIAIHSNWGTSFNAPTPLDEATAHAGAAAYTIGAVSEAGGMFAPAGVTPPANSYALILGGGVTPSIKPQTARTKSIGVDVYPPWVPGLSGSASYYHINYAGILGQPPYFSGPQYFQSFANLATINPTPAQITAFIAQAANGASGLTAVPGCSVPVTQSCANSIFAIENTLRTNVGSAIISGIDWSVSYQHDTDFGSIDANLQAHNQLSNDVSAGPGGVLVPQMVPGFNSTTGKVCRVAAPGCASINATSGGLLTYTLQLGANVGPLRAQATLNHTDGYQTLVTSTFPQGHVDAFNVINLYFQYDLDKAGFLDNATVSLNINNVLDQDPPLYKSTGYPVGGFANGSTLGRVVLIGFDKKI